MIPPRTTWLAGLALLLIVAVEVLLTRASLPPGTLAAALLALAFVEAGIALLYLMRLRYERPILLATVVATLVFVFVMMNHVWPDALRLLHQRTHR